MINTDYSTPLLSFKRKYVR